MWGSCFWLGALRRCAPKEGLMFEALVVASLAGIMYILVHWKEFNG